jgi:hypothetical protein
MYEYLRSWTGVADRPDDGALKTTGHINPILLGRSQTLLGRSPFLKSQADKTFRNLMNEYAQKAMEGMVRGPLYRLCNLLDHEQKAFVKDRIYISPCFEAFSMSRLEPGVNFALVNTRFLITDAAVPAVNLVEFNPMQKEILIRPGMLWAVTATRTSPTNSKVMEIGLTYIGNTPGDSARADALAKRVGLL